MMLRIRDATTVERPMLEALQRRSSDIWPEYRQLLATHPDAIELPQAFVDNRWVRVAVEAGDEPVGFSVLIPGDDGVHELDGLFVDPVHMRRGVGRGLVEDALALAAESGASCLEVTAGPARRFYEGVGFRKIGDAQTRFGPAVRLQLALQSINQIPQHEGEAMHAVVVNLTINEPDADLRALRDRVVPLVSRAPGFVTGYWTRRGNAGLSMIVFDSEHAADAAAEQLRSTTPDAVATLENMDVREVVAHA
jgi:GNAT superfamily N-acetyltransferase